MQKWLIGIDEAGRGPLAGPVAVGAVLVKPDFDWGVIEGVTDSKLLTEAKREAIYHTARSLKERKMIDYQITLVSSHLIDERGITVAIRLGMERILRALALRNAFACDTVLVKLDGALKAPAAYVFQETIIKGDLHEKSIGLASILAKVTRDTHMKRIARTHPQYGFEVHKGYGTKRHRACISEYGLTDHHRRSFCKNLPI